MKLHVKENIRNFIFVLQPFSFILVYPRIRFGISTGGWCLSRTSDLVVIRLPTSPDSFGVFSSFRHNSNFMFITEI